MLEALGNIEAGLPSVNLSVSKLPGSAFLGERKGSFDCDNFAKRRVNEPRLVQTYLATTVFVNSSKVWLLSSLSETALSCALLALKNCLSIFL